VGLNIQAEAQRLLAAWDGPFEWPLLSQREPGATLAEGFALGTALAELRRRRGEKPVGYKIGFTNRSIWQRYGVHAPIWAPVWDSTTAYLNGREGTLSLQGLSQPRLEPEIVFGFSRPPVAGMSMAELQACIGWVAHGFEVVHTHCKGWRFAAVDCLADFALHGRLRIGPQVDVAGWSTLAADLAALQLQLHCDSKKCDEGQGQVVLDGPLHALQHWLAAMAQHTPQWRVAAGDVVTTGTITDAWPLLPGQTWHTTLSAPRLAGLRLHTRA
jgi:2-oxo-3-hexenedioate decarboxylase